MRELRDELLELAVEMAHAAGRLLLAARDDGGADHRLATSALRKSSPTDLATSADLASEELIARLLVEARPDDALLGEEGGVTPGTSGITWIVDPLDGTTNYVYGFPAWCVSIAAADREGALVGVVHDPLRRETFAASRGRGAWWGGAPITRGAPPPLGEALVGTGFSYLPELRRSQAGVLATVLPAVRDIRRAGSAALDLCSVAVGRLDAFFECGLQPWDIAAGLLIARESGSASVELALHADRPTTLLVAPPPLSEELAGLLRQAASPG